MQVMENGEFVDHFEHTFPGLVGQSVLVALSGGRDSVALLHLLRDPKLGLQLEAAHVHHGLRGAEADEDGEFCRRLCEGLQIPFALIHLPDDDERPATGEAAWRRRRYRILLEHAAARGLATIATGHHRDDVAEGVLVQLLRGAGPRAMAGIATETSDGVIRPLLPWGRAEITTWLEQRQIDWREDGSNSDTRRLRNRVRHVVLPNLEDEAPHLREHLVNIAAANADAENFLTSEVRRRASFADPWDPEGGVDAAALRALLPALRTRWLHSQMLLLGVRHTTRRQLELFHRCLDTGEPRAVTMGGRWRLRAARGRIWAEPPSPPTGTEVALTTGAPTTFGIPSWQVRISSSNDPHPSARWRWYPPSARVEITLRPVRPDDTLTATPGVTRRVQKLLTEKLPRHLRAAWPLFCEDDMIHWIPGVWQHPESGDPSNRVVEVIRS
jgi:tRNA(Ile)-lysidine synthase